MSASLQLECHAIDLNAIGAAIISGWQLRPLLAIGKVGIGPNGTFCAASSISLALYAI